MKSDITAMKSDADVFWQRLAAVIMVVPAGSAPAFYISMVGFYALNFKSSIFFIGMLFALFSPYPVLPLIQHKLDGFFDDHFSTKTTYFFRVVCVQLILASVVLTWILAPQSPWLVLLVGVTIGIFSSANISSCHQLCAAMAPQLPQFAMIGEQLGAVLPILTLTMLAFEADASLWKFRIALSVVPIVCTLSALVLSYFHFKSELFEVAYLHLAYKDDEEDIPNYISEQAVPLEEGFKMTTPRQGVHSWVWYWMVAVGFMSALDGFTISLAPFFGDPTMAQQLALMKMAMNFVGKLSAIPISGLACFQLGPTHKSMTFLVVGYVVLALLIVARLARFNINTMVFLFSWCLLTAWYRFAGSYAIVTMLTYVEIHSRKFVARTNLIVVLGSCLVGVVLAFAVVYFFDDLNGTWPPMATEISQLLYPSTASKSHEWF